VERRRRTPEPAGPATLGRPDQMAPSPRLAGRHRRGGRRREPPEPADPGVWALPDPMALSPRLGRRPQLPRCRAPALLPTRRSRSSWSRLAWAKSLARATSMDSTIDVAPPLVDDVAVNAESAAHLPEHSMRRDPPAFPDKTGWKWSSTVEGKGCRDSGTIRWPVTNQRHRR
jgi:hypothetical protein